MLVSRLCAFVVVWMAVYSPSGWCETSREECLRPQRLDTHGLQLLPNAMHMRVADQAKMNSLHARCDSMAQGVSSTWAGPGAAFLAESRCHVQCRGAQVQVVTRKAKMDAVGKQLVADGDGGLIGSLSQTLVNWGQRNCLEAAAHFCGGLENVESSESLGLESKPKDLVSGRSSWTMPGQLACGVDTVPVLSPYDSGVALEAAGKADGTTNELVPRMKLTGQFVDDGAKDQNWIELRLEIARLRKTGDAESIREMKYLEGVLRDELNYYKREQARFYVKSSGCRAGKIKVKVCFGGCMCTWNDQLSLSEQTVQLLASGRDQGSTEVAICADRLVQTLSRAPYSRFSAGTRTRYCEEFAWATILQDRVPGAQVPSLPVGGTACSAYRGTVDCSGVRGLGQ